MLILFGLFKKSSSQTVLPVQLMQFMECPIPLPPQGFTDSLEVQTLRIMIHNFATQVRQQGQLPLLLLFNNQGYSDHLYQALAPTIQEADIATMSTHTLAPASDPRNFIGDGHFTPKANKLFATEVLKIIHDRLKK